MAHIIARNPTGPRGSPAHASVNTYDNLILLCPSHHTLVDKAPDDHSVELLLKWKTDWEAKVKTQLMARASATAANVLEMRLWVYFNFDLILNLHGTLPPDRSFDTSVRSLRRLGIIDPQGFPIPGAAANGDELTVFETWPQPKPRMLQQFYSGLVERVLSRSSIIDLDEVWGIRKLRALLYPTALVFVNRGFHFKVIGKRGSREDRRVQCRSRGVELTFQIDTWNVYSTSALNLHFWRRSTIAALLFVRSLESAGMRSRKLLIKATPVALGTGFWPEHNRTPLIAEPRYFEEE